MSSGHPRIITWHSAKNTGGQHYWRAFIAPGLYAEIEVVVPGSLYRFQVRSPDCQYIAGYTTRREAVARCAHYAALFATAKP